MSEKEGFHERKSIWFSRPKFKLATCGTHVTFAVALVLLSSFYSSRRISQQKRACLMLTAPSYLSQKFQQKLRLHIPFTTYYGLLNSIPASWRRKLKFTDSPNLNQISSSDSPKMNITTRSMRPSLLISFNHPHLKLKSYVVALLKIA